MRTPKNTIKELREIISNVPLHRVGLREGESLNDVYVKHGKEGLQKFISDPDKIRRLEMLEPVSVVNISTPNFEIEAQEIESKENEHESDQNNNSSPIATISAEDFSDEIADRDEILSERAKRESDFESDSLRQGSFQKTQRKRGLEVVHENKMYLEINENRYYALGGVSQDLSSMRITLMVEEMSTGRKERVKIDLYERDFIRNFSLQLGEQFNQSPEQIEMELRLLTDQLENYREDELHRAIKGSGKIKQNRFTDELSQESQRNCIEFLSAPNLLNRIDELIEKSGVVGEENTRKLLFVIASTYKMNTPLHALVQGSSGSGKSHLINAIGRCFPQEDVMSMTRVTSKSFYHYNKDELMDKLMLIQDFDGLDEEAQYAFRELQSAGNISSSTTYKDRSGNLVSAVKTVKSHFASLLATTKAEIYYDNMSRSVVIGVDESEEQTKKIIQYQNRKLAGLIDEREEKKATVFAQNCMRLIKPLEVVNKYADRIFLPAEAKMLRRLNSHYQSFVKQITILHQYQRKRDERGRLIAEIEDLKIACDILFDAIMLKVDDLDSSLRQFFNRMKIYIRNQAKDQGKHDKLNEFQFMQREIRMTLNISKSQCFRYMEDLELLEYVQKSGGYSNRGFRYKIVYWDDIEKTRAKIKQELNKQLDGLLKDEVSEQGEKAQLPNSAPDQLVPPLSLVHSVPVVPSGSSDEGTPESPPAGQSSGSGSEVQK